MKNVLGSLSLNILHSYYPPILFGYVVNVPPSWT